MFPAPCCRVKRVKRVLVLLSIAIKLIVFTAEINSLDTKMKTKQEEIDIFMKPLYMHQQLLSLVFLSKLKLNRSLTHSGNKPSTVQEN